MKDFSSISTSLIPHWPKANRSASRTASPSATAWMLRRGETVFQEIGDPAGAIDKKRSDGPEHFLREVGGNIFQAFRRQPVLALAPFDDSGYGFSRNLALRAASHPEGDMIWLEGEMVFRGRCCEKRRQHDRGSRPFRRHRRSRFRLGRHETRARPVPWRGCQSTHAGAAAGAKPGPKPFKAKRLREQHGEFTTSREPGGSDNNAPRRETALDRSAMASTQSPLL